VSNKEILEKAIQKAIDGGWNPDQTGFKTVKEVWSWYDLDRRGMKAMLIYSKSFAKALWHGSDPESLHLIETLTGRKAYGDRELLEQFTGESFISEWEFHLQNMVIVDNPIKYLGENI